MIGRKKAQEMLPTAEDVARLAATLRADLDRLERPREPQPSGGRPPNVIAKRLRRDESGVAAIMIALLLPAIVGVLALVVDSGMHALADTQAQVAADAAALAGAGVCVDGASSGEAEGVALQYVELNGGDAVEIVGDCSPGGSVRVVASHSWPHFLGGSSVTQKTAVADWATGSPRLVT